MPDRKIVKFTNINEQINILSKRNMKFDNVDFAKNMLFVYGYYNIINGYKEPYVQMIDGKEYYADGVTFERLFSLFTLDSNFRTAILTSTLSLEEHLRSVTSYVIGKNFGSDHEKYLLRENYKDRLAANPRFSLDSILETMNQAVNSKKDPIKYHRETYGNVPPWILVKGLYMNTLVNFIKFQNKDSKEEMIQAVYGISKETASLDSVKELFVNTLFVSLDYRNMAAHGGRAYNFHPKTRLRINRKFLSELSHVIAGPNELHEYCDISQFLYLLKLFRLNSISQPLEDTLNSEVTRHCRMYPEDIDYISSTTGLSFDVLTD